MSAANRLWETEPSRRTCLATVVEVKGDAFRLDRCLFRPRTKAYRHGQRADKGTVWLAGEKRRLATVYQQNGEVWHRLRGTVPSMGEELNCHLDAEQRDLDSRGHTGLHLILAALQTQGPFMLAADPEVKGSGRFRIDLMDGYVAPKQLAAALALANQWVEQNRPVGRFHITREEAPHRLAPQSFADQTPYPGPDTSLVCVEIDGVGAYPCDGTHVARTADVGRLFFREARPGRNGFMIIGEVARP